MEGWIGREIFQKLYTVESTAMNIKVSGSAQGCKTDQK